jgi:isopenicillin N synthase-like dioxygenase
VIADIGMFRVFPYSLKQARRVNVPRRCLATVVDTHETVFKIPIVDFGAFLKGNVEEKNKTAKQIVDGFTSSGFIYLGNTGLSKDSVSNVFSWSKRFFELPMEEKLKLAWETPESNRGYVAPGREKVSRLLSQEEIEKIRAASPDLKESLEIGKEPSDNYQVSRWFTVFLMAEQMATVHGGVPW